MAALSDLVDDGTRPALGAEDRYRTARSCSRGPSTKHEIWRYFLAAIAKKSPTHLWVADTRVSGWPWQRVRHRSLSDGSTCGRCSHLAKTLGQRSGPSSIVPIDHWSRATGWCKQQRLSADGPPDRRASSECSTGSTSGIKDLHYRSIGSHLRWTCKTWSLILINH